MQSHTLDLNSKIVPENWLHHARLTKTTTKKSSKPCKTAQCLPYCNGLQPNSDSLQPINNCEGLQKTLNDDCRILYTVYCIILYPSEKEDFRKYPGILHGYTINLHQCILDNLVCTEHINILYNFLIFCTAKKGNQCVIRAHVSRDGRCTKSTKFNTLCFLASTVSMVIFFGSWFLMLLEDKHHKSPEKQ